MADIALVKNVLFLVPLSVFDYDQRTDWGYRRMPAIRMPRRGDIIVFTSPADTTMFLCKRIVAMSGDTLEIRHGVVYVNNRRQKMPATVVPTTEKDTIRPVTFPEHNTWNAHNYGPLAIPEQNGSTVYFVMGDNRAHSIDSRAWGYVGFENIRGRIALKE